jgi:hypothetical protein
LEKLIHYAYTARYVCVCNTWLHKWLV